MEWLFNFVVTAWLSVVALMLIASGLLIVGGLGIGAWFLLKTLAGG